MTAAGGGGDATRRVEQRVKPWVVFPGGTKFGAGRAELLRLIDSEGSLNRAVHEMGMSYRAAWGYLRELEAAAGFALVARDGSGARLTDAGRAFLRAYEAYAAEVDAAAESAFRGAFAAWCGDGSGAARAQDAQ